MVALSLGWRGTAVQYPWVYQPQYERFEIGSSETGPRTVRFVRAVVFPAGDRMELFIFSDGQETLVVGVSGSGLDAVIRELRRHPSREEKVDLAGLFLKEKIEAGRPMVPEELTMRAGELGETARKLGLLP